MLARYGFNAIKLPFLHQHVLFDEDVPLASFDSHLNPQLLENGRPLKYVAAIRAIARRAASHGLLVFLVAHSLEGLWYSRAISEATVLDSWTALSRQYARAHSSSHRFLFSLLLTLRFLLLRQAVPHLEYCRRRAQKPPVGRLVGPRQIHRLGPCGHAHRHARQRQMQPMVNWSRRSRTIAGSRAGA